MMPSLQEMQKKKPEPLWRIMNEGALSAFVIAGCALELKHIEEKKAKQKRKFWESEWLKKRSRFSHENLISELRLTSPDEFRNYLRMSEECCEFLLKAVTPLIAKQDTVMRKSISARERLSATLRFLATGRSLTDLKFSVAISVPSLSGIIPETCEAIYKCLKGEYLKFPSNSAAWETIAKDFEDQWNFPNCGGAVDGKHVQIHPPARSGSFYHNYKGLFSVVLLAIVNANYEFIMVDVGRNGRVSDAGVLEYTEFYKKMKTDSLKLPTKGKTKAGMNFVFVGDEAFALHDNFLKPFPHKKLTKEKKIYNYRLSRARRTVENAFGILTKRFRIFQTKIQLAPNKIDIVVLACCALHNFLRKTNRAAYTPASAIDKEDFQSGTIVQGEWREEGSCGFADIQKSNQCNASASAKSNRDRYLEYFNGPGAVPWQNKMVTKTA